MIHDTYRPVWQVITKAVLPIWIIKQHQFIFCRIVMKDVFNAAFDCRRYIHALHFSSPHLPAITEPSYDENPTTNTPACFSCFSLTSCPTFLIRSFFISVYLASTACVLCSQTIAFALVA